MKLNRWMVAGAAAAVVLVPSAAIADPPGATNSQDFADSTGDAPSAVDITDVHTYRTSDGEYRAAMKFAGLSTQNGNRYYVSFASASASRGLGSLPDGNLVEFRRTPGGQVKTLSFKTTGGTNATPATCSGVRAVPDYTKSKITFIIPSKCWKGTSGAARVTAGSRHYPSDFDNTSNPPVTGGSDMQSDFLDESGTWLYATIG